MHYVTYEMHGSLRRATVSSSQYEKLSSDPNITSLQLYPSEQNMLQSYNEAKGIPISNKRLLHG